MSEKNQVLEVLADYDGPLEDIPAWCEKCGQEFIGVDEEDDYHKLYIRKVKEKGKGARYEKSLPGFQTILKSHPIVK